MSGLLGMTPATTTALQSKLGPITADADGTITVQEASDILDYSRFRVCELLSPRAGRVLVTDVLALKSPVQSRTLGAAPAASSPAEQGAPATSPEEP
jgi:hypothetical protein